jgi:hypothetical protein
MKNYLMFAIESLAPNSDYVIFGDEYSGIEWRDTVNTKPTEEEVNKKIADLQAEEPMIQLRDERNRRLAQTDWTQLPDTLINDAVNYIPLEQAWKDYRQQLRDLPSKSNPKLDSFGELDMTSVTWPTPPS